MKRLYRYKNSVVALSPEEYSKILADLEKSLRAELNYVSSVFFQEQLSDIKQAWPEPLRDFLKSRVAELGGDGKPTPEVIRQAVSEIIEDQARQRAKARADDKNLASILGYEFRAAAGDFALSMLFRKAPAAVPCTNREYADGLPARVQVSEKPVKIVVDCDKVDDAKFYVLAVYDDGAKRAYLAGWAGRTDLKNAPSGNRKTDPENCSWRNMAFYLHFEKMRPMKDLVAKLKIEEVPEGVLFETLPQKDAFPLATSLHPVLTKDEPDPGDDFGSFLEEDEKQGATSVAQPAEAKEDTDPDEDDEIGF